MILIHRRERRERGETKLGFFRYQFGDATLADGFPVEQNLEGGESLEQFIRFEQVQGMAGASPELALLARISLVL